MINKKGFDNPIREEMRKGVDLIGDEAPSDKQNKVEACDVYTTSNVRVRKCFREKIYTLKGRTGDTLQVIYDKIFTEYFKNNPL